MEKGYQEHGRIALLLLPALLAGFPTALFAAAGEPCLYENEPECVLLNQLWRDGTAAGNTNDWYRNADHDHATIQRTYFPQISDYGTVAYGFQSSVVDAPRVVIGNASLGISGMYSMVRYYGMPYYGNNVHTQYRANQAYWYPAVELRNEEPTWRDLNTGMFPYANQSIGKSGSELDEITKFFHTLAAFKPAVKTKLTDEGLLIPTLQMIYRRTRVASDAEYLTGLTHPSAFDDYSNDVAMINMAQAMDTNNIPPMIDLVVEEETYGDMEIFKYNDAYKSEKIFTTPAAIARIFRGTEYTKQMVVDAGASTDVNGLPLTYHFAVLRGDPARVRITPLNAEGSRVEIEIDYHPEAVDPDSGRLSNLAIIGAFVNNGAYYSAPGFITSFSLRNETRTYDGNHLLAEILYTDEGPIEYQTLSRDHAWNKDSYTHDFNQRMAGWMRDASGSFTPYTAEGLLQTSTDADGRALTATAVSYSFSGDITPTPSTNWIDQMEYAYTNFATPTDTPLNSSLGGTNWGLGQGVLPEHGTVTFATNTFTYIPDTGFTGIDAFAIKGYDYAAEEVRMYKMRIAVGAPDTTAPDAPQGISVYGTSSSEAFLSWPHTIDNMEVYGYHIYRDGSLLGTSYVSTTFADTSAAPGVAYNYTVTAFDDAGNESGASSAVSGGAATLWGQDDFEDGNYTVADPALTNGLTWTLDSGAATINALSDLLPELNGNWMKVGVYTPEITRIMPPAGLPTPFLIEFHDAQKYAVDRMGLVFLYQDTNNYYSLEISRDVFALHRTMGGVKTTLGTAPELKMQHAWCSAKFAVQVVGVADAVVIDCTKSEWTTYGTPPNTSAGSQSVHWVDTNATAAATFTQGRIGFYSDLISNWNVAYYDNILISSLAGDGPDRDADRMADAWEMVYFGSTSASDGTGDFDTDGLVDGGEEIAGTNPTDSNSVFKVSNAAAQTSDGFVIRWPSVAGRKYAVDGCSNLVGGVWSNIESNIPPTPSVNMYTVQVGNVEQLFNRVSVRKD